jgi:hypothetical protein
VVFVLAALLAIIAGIQLYIFTDFTDQWFAWTIEAPLSAAFLGAGYWTGATLLLLGARERAWANIRIALAAVGAFVPLMLLTTFLHLDRFHLNSAIPSAWVAAWAWIIVYVVVPFLVLAILVVQMRTPGGDPPRLALVSPMLRILIGVNAVIALLLGLALFLFPDAMTPLWAWPLTPLTARAIGAGFLTMAVGSVQFIRENDWRRTRIGTIPYMLVGALHLLALVRYPGTVEWSRPGTWLYILFMTAVLLGGLFSAIMAWRPAANPERPAK